MSNSNVPEAQFSIYRIDYERVSEVMQIVGKKVNNAFYKEIKTAIINSTVKILEKKDTAEYKRVKYLDFEGVIFKTKQILLGKILPFKY